MNESEKCGTCQKPRGLECPCGTAKCKLFTPMKHCSTCAPEESAKEQKFQGIQVCPIVVRKELGLE